MASPKRRNVKSQSKRTTDQHERDKDFLTAAEMDRLLVGAKTGRHGIRNYLLLMMMYRHGLRVSEAITVRIKDVDLKRSRLWVRRLKNGLSVEQPIPGDELRAIKRYLKQREDRLPWLFISEREQAMTRRSVNYIVENAADRAGLDPVHPHMLRHSCGFYLADQGLRSAIDSGLPGTSRSQAPPFITRALPVAASLGCGPRHKLESRR